MSISLNPSLSFGTKLTKTAEKRVDDLINRGEISTQKDIDQLKRVRLYKKDQETEPTLDANPYKFYITIPNVKGAADLGLRLPNVTAVKNGEKEILRNDKEALKKEDLKARAQEAMK